MGSAWCTMVSSHTGPICAQQRGFPDIPPQSPSQTQTMLPTPSTTPHGFLEPHSQPVCVVQTMSEVTLLPAQEMKFLTRVLPEISASRKWHLAVSSKNAFLNGLERQWKKKNPNKHKTKLPPQKATMKTLIVDENIL